MRVLSFSKLTVALVIAIALNPDSGIAQKKEISKIEDATNVLSDIQRMKDKIPDQLFEQSEGIIIIPKMLNAGLGIGGKRGKGIAIAKQADGSWSDPSFITLTGGSFGLQAGVQSVDLILFFKHSSNMLKIGKSNFTIGGDMSATAGPVGRSATAGTDFKLQSEIYSYSRSRGLFAGISLNGASLKIDKNANEDFYHKKREASAILSNATPDLPVVDSLRNLLNHMR